VERGIKSLEEYQERVRGWERRVGSYAAQTDISGMAFCVIFLNYQMAKLFAPQMMEELCPVRILGYRIWSPNSFRFTKFAFYSGQGLRPYTPENAEAPHFLEEMLLSNIRTIECWFETNAPGVSPWVREVI